jgi:hypothetical protein
MSASSSVVKEVEGEGEALLPVDDDILDVLLEDDDTDAGTAFLQTIKLPADSRGVTSGKQAKAPTRGMVDMSGTDKGEVVDDGGNSDEEDGEDNDMDEVDRPYDSSSKKSRNMADGVWLQEEELVEVLALRGNFWRIMGFTDDKRMFLHPEEALILVERGQLRVRPSVDSSRHISSSSFYAEVLHSVPQAVILAFNKLRNLDYIVHRYQNRHTRDRSKPARALTAFSCDAEVEARMRANPMWSLLETLVAFDIYPNSSAWSKKSVVAGSSKEGAVRQAAHVIVSTGDWTMNSRLMAYCLKESRGVPIVFAAVLPSGNLILEEFTDATSSLKWDNEYAIDINFSSKVTMESVIPPKMRPKHAGEGKTEKETGPEDENGGKRKRGPSQDDETDSDLGEGEGDGDEEVEEEEEEEDVF